MNDILNTDTSTLCSMAEGIKINAKALQNINKAEAMRLFVLFRRITEELFRRDRVQKLRFQAYKYN